MDQLFKKAFVTTDAHLGRSGGSPQANQDTLDFYIWAVDRAKSWGAETAIFAGDLFDSRHSIGLQTLDYALKIIELLNSSFKQVFLIIGNHDCYHRANRDVTSVAFTQLYQNVTVFQDITTIDGVSFLPWLVGDEHKKVKSLKSRYVFSHLELPGFMMNAQVVAPPHSDGIQADDFVNQEYVFSGHFHKRQMAKGAKQKTNISYIGNTFPFNFSDAWDSDRGLMLLEWGSDPVFESWPGQPLFRTMKLSEMLENPGRLLLPKMTVRASVDVGLMYEEVQEIRDTLLVQYGVRKIELVHQSQTDESKQSFADTTVAYQSVDQIVEEGLRSVDSNDLDKDRLIEIYRNLQIV